MPDHNDEDDVPFAYRTSKDGKVFVTWYGKTVTVLKGPQAQRLLRRLATQDDAEVQLELARITGNFKRGNERQAKHANEQEK